MGLRGMMSVTSGCMHKGFELGIDSLLRAYMQLFYIQPDQILNEISRV